MDKNSVIEEQNGSAQSIKQFVWGKSYIDELIQTALNSSPTTQTTCDTLYWTCQDANWNVLGVVNSSGVLRERYEYTPYGERQVYFSSGSNDVGCYAPIVGSQKFVAGSTAEPWGICEVGHQGLMHDEECGLVYNRVRYLSPAMGRFIQRDPLLYLDSCNLYLYEKSLPNRFLDSSGQCNECYVDELTFEPTEVKATEDGGLGGIHGVSIKVKLKWHVANDTTRSGPEPCKLLWYEWGTERIKPPDNSGDGVPPNKWVQLIDADGINTKEMFKNLTDADFTKNGSLTIQDSPGGGERGVTQWRWWAIKAYSSGKGVASKKIFGEFHMVWGNGITKGEFKQVDSIPNSSPPDESGPGAPAHF